MMHFELPKCISNIAEGSSIPCNPCQGDGHPLSLLHFACPLVHHLPPPQHTEPVSSTKPYLAEVFLLGTPISDHKALYQLYPADTKAPERVLVLDSCVPQLTPQKFYEGCSENHTVK